MVTDELTKLQVKKFKYFLGKWVHNFKEQNQLINVVDCMFVALEKTDQKDVAMKWYMRVTDPKETRCLEKLLEYKTAEVNMWKANMKAMKKQKGQAKMILRNQYKKAKEDMKKRYQRQLDIKCGEIKDLKSENSKFSRFKEYLEQLEEKNKTLNLKIDELEDQKWKLHKIVGKYQQEVKQ